MRKGKWYRVHVSDRVCREREKQPSRNRGEEKETNERTGQQGQMPPKTRQDKSSARYHGWQRGAQKSFVDTLRYVLYMCQVCTRPNTAETQQKHTNT